jgi:hypothetical protein
MTQSVASNKNIFISYSHTDNENPLGEGWIEQFHEVLRTRLKQLLGARDPEDEPSIWRDKELQGNEEFADVLYEKLGQVAITISILSPSYVASDWCRREIEEFVKAAEAHGGLTVDNKTRLFKVLKTPVDRERHPEPLRGQLGYEFYLLDKDTGQAREFTLLKGDSHTALALERFNDLAHSIVNTLAALQTTLAETSGPQDTTEPEREATLSPQDTPRPSVYLAETSFDLDEEQRKVRRELESRGYRVVPEGELPIRNPEQFNSAVREALGSCKLSIHMIGAHRAAGVAGESEDTVALQNQVAAELSSDTGLERLIWLPPNLESKDELNQRFIERLQRDPTAQSNAEVLQVPIQELITVIHDTLEKQEKSKGQGNGKSDRRSIYVCYAQEDEEKVHPLIAHLFDNGFDLLQPLLDPNAADGEILEIHKRNLADCNATVLFADNAGEFWLKTQMSEVQRASAWRGGRPMAARAIYIGPNMITARNRILTHDFVIEGCESFAPEALAPFLAALTQNGGDS